MKRTDGSSWNTIDDVLQLWKSLGVFMVKLCYQGSRVSDECARALTDFFDCNGFTDRAQRDTRYEGTTSD